MKILIGIQARLDSKRFPNKVFSELEGKPILLHLYEKCLEIQEAHSVKILVPKKELSEFRDKALVLNYFGGHPTDLFERYREAMNSVKADAVIRLTGDCPLVPQALIKQCIGLLETYDYVSNTCVRTYPDGFDVQGCSKKAFVWLANHQQKEREHPFKAFDMNEIIRDEFEAAGLSWCQLVNIECANQLKLSVDTPEDLERVQQYYVRDMERKLERKSK